MASIVADAIKRLPVPIESIASGQQFAIHLLPFLDYDRLLSYGILELPEEVYKVIMTRARKKFIQDYEKKLVDDLERVRLAKKQFGIDTESEE
jgi:hypothetical protein